MRMESFKPSQMRGLTATWTHPMDIKLILGDFGYLPIVNGLIDIFEANFFFKDIVFGRKFIRCLSFSSPSSSSTSPIHSSSNPLTDKVARPNEHSPKHNIFEEEVCFEDINQAIDNWEIPKIPQDELYVPDDNKRKSDYIIKTAENNIPLGPDFVAVKPLIREGLNTSILMCLRDIRHNDFQDSLIGTVETSLGHGPVYFNCFPNKMVSLLDNNILDSLFLNIQIHGLNMKEGSIPADLIYRIQYKVMNTCNSRVLLKSQDRETTLFVTDMTKVNVMIPRIIRWDEIDLPQSWSIDRAIPTQPRQAPLLREIKQDESGKVEIFFDRRNSFSSRSEAGTSNDFASARRSEFPPKGAFIISNTEGHNPVMASPFKSKNVDEAVAPKDIKNHIEQSNYTNRFLQCLGDNLSSSGSGFSMKNVSEVSTSKSINKSLFKPFKMSSRAKQSLKTPILKQQSGDSQVIQKIDQLLNRFTIVLETPTNSGESTSRIQTCSSKAINALGHESNESSSEQSDDSGKTSLKVSPIMTNSLTKWKGLTKPSAYGYNRVSAPDLVLKERELGFVSFNANNVYEWNIDGKIEYNIMSMLQHMTMVGTTYQAAHETSEEAIANVIVFGFSGQLKGWWDNYLSDGQKQSIFSAIKLNDQNEPIIEDDGEPIPNAVNTLIFTIASHFIGDPSLWKDRSAELLSNLRCKTLSDFRWYKDTFLTRVYTREDSQQPFWKEKFLTRLPKSLGDKVRGKIRSLTPNGIIPYDELSYGQLISFIQKVALKICQDDKIQRQLAREKIQNHIELGTFCEQFGLPACHPRKSKRPSNRKKF
ncbi:polyprotein [Arachis hypogaea]|nr:polyprotein [Arachis hypogaea]